MSESGPRLPIARPSATARATTLVDLHREFLAEQRFSARLSPVTLRGYAQSFALLQSLLPGLSAEQLTAETLTEFFRRLESRPRVQERGETVAGVKSSTIATYRSKLNRFFSWLQARGHIPRNPFAGMPYPTVRYDDRKYLGRSEVERIFSVLVLQGPWRSRFLWKRNIALFSLLLYTGIRKGELLALRVTDLDLDRLELTVRPETSKSRLRRVVPINAHLCLALEDYLHERHRLRLQSEYLLTNSKGTPLTADGLKHLVNQAQRLSGVPFHVHRFRHTFAVNVLNQGGDIAKLKQLLGHRDIRMTAQYLRALPARALRTDVERVSLEALL